MRSYPILLTIALSLPVSAPSQQVQFKNPAELSKPNGYTHGEWQALKAKQTRNRFNSGQFTSLQAEPAGRCSVHSEPQILQ